MQKTERRSMKNRPNKPTRQRLTVASNDTSKNRQKAGAFAQAIDLVLNLMPIPGPSGKEGEISAYVQEKIIAAGIERKQITIDDAFKRSPIGGETGNLVVHLPGTLKAPSKLFSAHLDTVPLCVGTKPVLKGRLIVSSDPTTGLGADNRAGVAVLLNTLLAIVSKNLPHPPITFCWFVQEEVGLLGSRYMRKSLLGKPSAAFNYDGGAANKVTIGATGGYRMNGVVRGLASHAGGSPEKGISAIAIASLAIADLVRSGWHGLIEKGNSRGTSNVGVIEGGAATNVVCNEVHLKAEARSHSPKFREKIVREIHKSFSRAAREVRNVAGARGSVEFEGRLDYESFLLPRDSPSVLAAQNAIQTVGLDPILSVSNGGLDANWLFVHGIQSVTLGCGQVSPHTVEEALDIREFENACAIALELAKSETHSQ